MRTFSAFSNFSFVLALLASCSSEEDFTLVRATSGVCLAGCDDDNPCTRDACRPGGSCDHQPLTDGAPCGPEARCASGECTPLTQSATLLPSVDSCSSQSACDDGNPCNGNERCDLSQGCVRGQPLDCDDGDDGTVDGCNPRLGCLHASVGSILPAPTLSADAGAPSPALDAASPPADAAPSGAAREVDEPVVDAGSAAFDAPPSLSTDTAPAEAPAETPSGAAQPSDAGLAAAAPSGDTAEAANESTPAEEPPSGAGDDTPATAEPPAAPAGEQRPEEGPLLDPSESAPPQNQSDAGMDAPSETCGADAGCALPADASDGGQCPPESSCFPSASVTIAAEDTGHFVVMTAASGPVAAFRWRAAGARRDHQSYWLGHETVVNAAGTSITERRAYFLFDLSTMPSNVTEASLRVWTWKNGAASTCFLSASASETVTVHPLSDATLAALPSLPFAVADTGPNDLDLPAWEDLGDGDAWGQVTVDSTCGVQPDLMPSPLLEDPASVDCDGLNAPCGKWLEVALTPAALASMSGTGVWGLGARLSTADHPEAGERREYLFMGTSVDLPSNLPAYPNFLAPPPELVLRTAASR